MREDIKKRIEQIRRGEVPEGYESKRGVGIFPVDWRLERLVKYVDKIVDGTHVTPKYVENGVPFFSVETVTSNDFENVKFITLDEHLQLSKRCKVEKGDILLTRIGTIGKTALVDWDEEGSIYVSLALIKISDQNLRSYFYEYSKSSLFLKEVLRKSLLLATPPKINMNDIEKVELVLPTSRAEQRKIAEILSTCDRVIDLKRKLIEEKRKVKKWLMQTLLTGMIRVKDIENGTPYEELKKRIDQIRNGQIPEGYEKKRNVGIFPVDWELQRLVKYADKVVDGTHATPKYVENGVPFYSVETITSNDFKNVKFISHEEHLRLSKRCKVEKGDILLTRIGTIGKTALVDWDEEGSIYVSLALIKISDQNLRSYFYEYSKSSLFVKEVLRKSLLLATPPKINMNDIEKVKLVISSSGVERTRIAEILSTADKEIDLLNKDLEQWELKKKSLMQLLLTGIVRTTA